MKKSSLHAARGLLSSLFGTEGAQVCGSSGPLGRISVCQPLGCGHTDTDVSALARADVAPCSLVSLSAVTSSKKRTEGSKERNHENLIYKSSPPLPLRKSVSKTRRLMTKFMAHSSFLKGSIQNLQFIGILNALKHLHFTQITSGNQGALHQLRSQADNGGLGPCFGDRSPGTVP